VAVGGVLGQVEDPLVIYHLGSDQDGSMEEVPAGGP
jgi:hypothetical protein